MDEFKAQVVPDKIRVLPDFEITNHLEVRVANMGDKEITGSLQMLFPRDIEWRLNETSNTGNYDGEFTLPPGARRKLEIELRAVGSEPRDSSIAVRIDTKNETELEKVVPLQIKPE